MRDKHTILEDIHRNNLKGPGRDTTASLHERVTIEVLVDIRDILRKELKRIAITLASFPGPH